MRKIRFFLVVLFILIVPIGFFAFWASGRHTVPIMMYHHVEETEKPSALYVSPERFRWHMTYLKEHGYNVIPLEDLVETIKQDKPLPRKTVVITFDDGYANNYTNAFEVLKQHHFPATIFIPSDFVGRESYLTAEQLQEMARFGIMAGSHTTDHAYLPDVSRAQQIKEVNESKRLLEERLNRPIEYFAYPNGGFDEGVKEIVRAAGYKGACATNRGYDLLNNDVYELNRIRFSDKDNSRVILMVKLSGFYNLFRQPKSTY